jgi:hypothetical protein
MHADDLRSLITQTENFFARLYDLSSLPRLLQTPHPTPLSRRARAHATFCTTHAAVTHSPLDRTKTSRLKSECAKFFFAKFSTRQKYFVLVCRLFYFLKFSFDQAIRSRKTGGALH